jgi:hypothetical protein
MDEVGKFHGISDEENRGVVTGKVPVTLFCIELNSKAWIKISVPLGSRTVSAPPFSGATTENLAKTGVILPTD